MMKLINKYIEYLRYEKNYSSHTEISYFTDLSQFVDFLQKFHPEVELQTVDSDVVRLWLVQLMRDKVSPRSVNRKLSALKSFYKYLLKNKEVSINPTLRVVGPRMSKPIPVFVNDKDMEMLLEDVNVECNDFVASRDNIILEMFYVTGIRRAELIGIKDVDVDFHTRTVQVTGKRNKQRLIPLSEAMCDRLKVYMQKRDEEVEKSSDALFVKLDGQPLYPMLLHKLISNQLKTIPTLAKTSPHVLRHSFATSMLNNGADINAVKELLGHSSLAATEVYTHTSFEELKNIYNKAHPRA